MPGIAVDGSGFDSEGIHGASASCAAPFSLVLPSTTQKIPPAKAGTPITAPIVIHGRPYPRVTTGADVLGFFAFWPLAIR